MRACQLSDFLHPSCASNGVRTELPDEFGTEAGSNPNDLGRTHFHEWTGIRISRTTGTRPVVPPSGAVVRVTRKRTNWW